MGRANQKIHAAQALAAPQVEIFNQAVDGFDDLIQPLPDKVKGVKAGLNMGDIAENDHK